MPIRTGAITMSTTDASLLRLLQLSSVSLPVGGYAFSQGLEYAVECGWVNSVEDTAAWLQTQIDQSLGYVDLPVLAHAWQAAASGDGDRFNYCNDLVLACRETAELRLTDTAMGTSLQRVLTNLELPPLPLQGRDCSFVVAFAWAAQQWQIELEATLLGYSWSWLENQVAAATKLVPLGQTQAQALLSQLQGSVASTVTNARQLELDEVGACLPALAIASCQHETQYTRLFRS
ncbi:MAG: urease accessory protein UreF [Gammaproteobacteria bacterium]|nr:urease accessory protein UreF [Gammaproteobacteria bacterium]